MQFEQEFEPVYIGQPRDFQDVPDEILIMLGKDPAQKTKGKVMRFRFENGYGASVVSHIFSHGNIDQWELAVVWYSGESNDDFGLVYDTPVADDVIGHLSWSEVEAMLKQIKALPKRAEPTSDNVYQLKA